MHFGLISDFNQISSNLGMISFMHTTDRQSFNKSDLSLQVEEAKVSRFPTLSPPYNDCAKRKVLKTESAVSFAIVKKNKIDVKSS